MTKRVNRGLIGVPAFIIFLATGLVTASYPAQTEAQSRTRRGRSRPMPVPSPTNASRPPVEPTELNVDNVLAILPRLRTCLTHDLPARTMDVEDGQYPSQIMFNDNRDKYEYLEKRGWIRTQVINRMIYIFFTPEAERLFFGGNPPEWASVEVPSEEARRGGYNRRRLKVTFARLELMRIVDVTPGPTPDMNRTYVVTALWRWKATGADTESARPRPFVYRFEVERINGKWELTPRSAPSGCSEVPFYGKLPDSTLTIEPSTITLDSETKGSGNFSVFFNNHDLVSVRDAQGIRMPCRLEDGSLGQPHKGNNAGYIYPTIEARKRGGETTLICEFAGLTTTARVVIAPPPPPPPLIIEPAIIEARVGQTAPYLVLSRGKNIAGHYTEGSWFLRCAVADKNIARSERRRDREVLIGLRPGETTLNCINRGVNQTLPSQTGTARVIVK